MDRKEAIVANEIGKNLVRQGRRDEAAANFVRAIQLDPEFAEAHNNFAVLLKRCGRLDEAIATYSRAILLKPDYVEAYVNLGNTLAEAGRRNEAVDAYQKALALRPSFSAAENALGLALLAAGRNTEAADMFTRLVASHPRSAMAHNNLATALRRLGCAEQAITLLNKAIEMEPSYALAHANRGLLLGEMRQFDAAIASMSKAIELQPGDVRQVMGLLGLLRSLGRGHQAIGLCNRIIGQFPAAAEVRCTLADLLRESGQIDTALVECRKALTLKPDDPDCHNVLGNIQRDQGRLDAAIASYHRALALRPDAIGIRSNLVFSLLFSPEYDAVAILKETRIWAELHEKPLLATARPHGNARVKDRRLRIGYVCSYFRRHSAACFLLPVLARHDRERVEIFCYFGGAEPDEITERFQALGHGWRDIAGLADAELAELIRTDGIDILVDLALHMQDSRLLAFARKPAPVQATWLGYPGTTGLSSIDYRLTDPYIDPPDQNDEHYSERSIRLPTTFWCYAPLYETPPPTRAVSSNDDQIVFGCFNNFHKVSPETLALWARVLLAVPDSRLVILSPPGSHRDAVQATFEKAGVEGHRTSFVPRLPLADYFRLYQGVDVCLDTIPYPGHTTTLDSLWMGVPVVTLAGRTSVARGGVSILTNVGLSNLIARSAEEYITIAAALAQDPAGLATLRGTLRDRLLASPLMDARRFAADLEDAYAGMWATHCAAAVAGDLRSSPSPGFADTISRPSRDSQPEGVG